MKVMGGFVVAWMVAGIVAGHAPVVTAQKPSPATVPACRTAEVTVTTATPTLRAGTRPQFSVAITNKSERSIRVLDVRNGRRVDLQDNYFELVIVEGSRLVDLPIAISDPGPIGDADYAVLKPGERFEVGSLSYKLAAEELRPGKYSAFILFWQGPYMPHTSRCRSSEARFVVSK